MLTGSYGFPLVIMDTSGNPSQLVYSCVRIPEVTCLTSYELTKNSVVLVKGKKREEKTVKRGKLFNLCLTVVERGLYYVKKC